jgi:hypothetical protein
MEMGKFEFQIFLNPDFLLLSTLVGDGQNIFLVIYGKFQPPFKIRTF